MTTSKYSGPPKNVPDNFTDVSQEYKRLVKKVMSRIVLFLFTYLLVIFAGILFVIGGLYASWFVLKSLPIVFGVFIALGILMVPLMFFWFLTKFLTKKQNKEDGLVKITFAEQPDLFEFVYKICVETKSEKPKNIYLSHRVNASVFYETGFLSLFLPARKNLEIGVGLVNSINLTEFKAIIAHEFGHFSQSSTKLGTYVYSLNRIIYNLLYENQGWYNTLQSISRTNVVMRFFCQITLILVKIVIQLFARLYDVINIPYLALSREMEYHADLVAASVSGSKPIINALYRSDYGENIQQYLLNVLNDVYLKEKRLPANVFKIHSHLMAKVALSHKLDLIEGLPLINSETINRTFIKDRVSIKDLWASHPSIKEREKNTHRYFLEAEINNSSAWNLFRNKQKLQECLSVKVYEKVYNTAQYNIIPNDEMIERLEEMDNNLAFDPRYYDFYNYASETMVVPECKEEDYNSISKLKLNELYNEENSYNLRVMLKNKQEIELLEAIQNKSINVNGYEFDGKQYSEDSIQQSILIIKNEVQQLEQWLKEHKLKLANWFYVKLFKLNEQMANDYRSLMALRVKTAKDATAFISFYHESSRFYDEILSGKHSDKEIKDLSNTLDRLYRNNQYKISALEDTEMKDCYRDIPELNVGYKLFLNGFSITDPNATQLQHLDGINKMREDIEKALQQLSEFDNKVFKKIIALQAKVLDLQLA